MEKHTGTRCDECEEELIHVEGEYFCPSCDSVSGFELVPDHEEFTL